MTQENNTQAAIDAGKEIAGAAQKLQDVGGIPITMNHQGQVMVHTSILAEQDKRAEKPRRLMGTAVLGNEQGFIDHVQRFKDNDTVIFGSRDSLTVVYDYHRIVSQGLEAGSVPNRDAFARWGQHRATFTPEMSDEWKAWIGGAKKPLGQEAFAEYIDENVRDIAKPTNERQTPSAGSLATMALNLKVMADKTMESTVNPTTGEYTLIAKEEHKTTGSTQIPAEFDIEIPIFTGAPKTRITCKIRFRKGDGKPTFAWIVPGADALKRQAMEEMIMRVRAATQLPLMNGQPEQ